MAVSAHRVFPPDGQSVGDFIDEFEARIAWLVGLAVDLGVAGLLTGMRFWLLRRAVCPAGADAPVPRSKPLMLAIATRKVPCDRPHDGLSGLLLPDAAGFPGHCLLQPERNQRQTGRRRCRSLNDG